MIKNFTAVAAIAILSATSSFAGANKGCCAAGTKTAANHENMQCISFANLNLTPDQKTKLDAMEADCHKGGCNAQTHAKFLQQAKGVLSAEQYAQLEKNCKASVHKGKAS